MNIYRSVIYNCQNLKTDVLWAYTQTIAHYPALERNAVTWCYMHPCRWAFHALCSLKEVKSKGYTLFTFIYMIFGKSQSYQEKKVSGGNGLRYRWEDSRKTEFIVCGKKTFLYSNHCCGTWTIWISQNILKDIYIFIYILHFNIPIHKYICYSVSFVCVHVSINIIVCNWNLNEILTEHMMGCLPISLLNASIILLIPLSIFACSEAFLEASFHFTVPLLSCIFYAV